MVCYRFFRKVTGPNLRPFCYVVDRYAYTNMGLDLRSEPLAVLTTCTQGLSTTSGSSLSGIVPRRGSGHAHLAVWMADDEHDQHNM